MKFRPSVDLVLIGSVTAVAIRAQTPQNPLVWVDPTNQVANYLEAAVLKKGTPVAFTTEKENAAYLASLDAVSKKGSAARAIFLGPANSGAQTDLSLTVSDAKSGAVVFAYTCQKGDGKSFQSASECLAKHWKNFIEKGKP